MKTISIQVVPFEAIEHHCTHDIQPQGPTANTPGWAIYERKEDGSVEWFADCRDESALMSMAYALARPLGVPIEPRPWDVRRKQRKQLTAELTDAYFATGNQGSFEAWLRDMAANPAGTLQLAAQELMILKGMK